MRYSGYFANMHNETESELFNLVKTLTKGEKRYFKLYAHTRSVHTEELNYITLFDVIEKQKQYNEEKIKRLGLVRDEHLPMLKNYLYKLILESLRSLKSKSDDVDSKISGLLENARIMRDKGLENEQIKYLMKARQLAIKYERWGMALEGIFMERRIRVRKESAEPWRNIDKETEEVMDVAPAPLKVAPCPAQTTGALELILTVGVGFTVKVTCAELVQPFVVPVRVYIVVVLGVTERVFVFALPGIQV